MYFSSLRYQFPFLLELSQAILTERLVPLVCFVSFSSSSLINIEINRPNSNISEVYESIPDENAMKITHKLFT